MDQDPYLQLQLLVEPPVQLPAPILPPQSSIATTPISTPTSKPWELMNHTTLPPAAAAAGQSMMDLSSRQLQIAQCRWNLEEYLRPLISQWLQADLPLLDWVYHLGKQQPQQPQQHHRQQQQQQYYSKYLILLVTIHLDPQSTERPFRQANSWQCQDETGQFRPAKLLVGGKTYIASQRILIQCRMMGKPLVGLYHQPTRYFYNVTPWRDCDQLESSVSSSLSSSTSSSVSSTSSWTLPSISIGACLRIRGMHESLEPWIRYHRHIGIQHFWIFLNQPTNSSTILPNMFFPQKSPSSSSHVDNNDHSITWIPYNYYAPDFVHDTPNNSYSRSSILRHGKHFWQSTTQMQCLYHAKRLGVDWIITLDVDEYIWIHADNDNHDDDESDTTTTQNTTTFTVLNKNDTTDSTPRHGPSLVQSLLSPYTSSTTVGALTMWSIPFGSQQIPPSKVEQQLHQQQEEEHSHPNPNTKTATNTTTTTLSSSPLPLEYVYRQSLSKILAKRMDRQKCWYHVPIATDITIHQLRKGGQELVLPISQVYIHHYKQPHLGVFQAKQLQDLEPDTKLRDFYHHHHIYPIG